MSKWKQSLFPAMEEAQQIQPVSKYEIAVEARELEIMFDQLSTACESLEDLKKITSCLPAGEGGGYAAKIAAISAQSACMRLGFSNYESVGLESINNKVALENVFHRGWEAIKKFFKMLMDKIIGFFSKKKQTLNKINNKIEKLRKDIKSVEFKPHELDDEFLYNNLLDKHDVYKPSLIEYTLNGYNIIYIRLTDLLIKACHEFTKHADEIDIFEQNRKNIIDIFQHDSFLDKKIGLARITFASEDSYDLKSLIKIDKNTYLIGRIEPNNFQGIDSNSKAEKIVDVLEQVSSNDNKSFYKLKSVSGIIADATEAGITANKNLKFINQLSKCLTDVSDILISFIIHVEDYIDQSIRHLKAA